MKSLTVENFAAFGHAELQFSPALNVFIGENGTGKTLLMKLPYAVMRVLAEARPEERLTKTWLQRRIAEKLVGVIRPESLGRLVKRRRGRQRCTVAIQIDDQDDVAFNFAASSRQSVAVAHTPRRCQTKPPIFLPTRELLTIYPGFLAFYDNHYTEFDETWRDTCQLLGSLPVKGPREHTAAQLLGPLEKAMGGRVVHDPANDRFYLQATGTGKMEMPLVAEGIRKLGMLARLAATGALAGKARLFWDEPETNLNPQLIRRVAQALLDICAQGVQVFIATHSLFLLREFEVLLATSHTNVRSRFFAFERAPDDVAVQQDNSLIDIEPLVLLDEDLRQSDRYLAMDRFGDVAATQRHHAPESGLAPALVPC